MRSGKVTPANSGASTGRERFNVLEFFPELPDVMWWWPKGVLPPPAGTGKQFKSTEAQAGAVTLIQRFGSALNLNIHFHMLFLENELRTKAEQLTVQNLFNLGRHLVRAQHYRDLRTSAFNEWNRAVA